MKTFYRALAGNLESVGPREFRGVAATSGMKDDGIDLVMAGGDLSRLENGAPLLFNHNPDHILGRILSVRATATALPFTATFANAGVSAHIDEKCALLKDGILKSISLGFMIDESERRDTGSRPGIRALRWTALEISLVAVPLDSAAVVTSRARRSGRVLSQAHHGKLTEARACIDEARDLVHGVISAAEEADPQLAQDPGAAAEGDGSRNLSDDLRRRRAELDRLRRIGEVHNLYVPPDLVRRRTEIDRLRRRGEALALK